MSLKKLRNYETPDIVSNMLKNEQMEVWMGHPSRLFLEKIVDEALTQYKRDGMKHNHRAMSERFLGY